MGLAVLKGGVNQIVAGIAITLLGYRSCRLSLPDLATLRPIRRGRAARSDTSAAAARPAAACSAKRCLRKVR